MTAKISVALASFNGIKFIGEQLDSIREQTKAPDEVIISDDILLTAHLNSAMNISLSII